MTAKANSDSVGNLVSCEKVFVRLVLILLEDTLYDVYKEI